MKAQLILFPLAVLAISIILQIGALQSNAQNPISFAGNGGGQQNTSGLKNYQCVANNFAHFKNIGSTACFSGNSLPSPATITCVQDKNLVYNVCDLIAGCPLSNPPQGIYCVYTFQVLSLFPQYEAMDSGYTLSINSNGDTTSQTSPIPNANFAFSSLGVAGFITMVGVGVAVAALSGISVFGSGENSESVHILFICGLLLGLWFILSAAEGYLTGASTSFFLQLDKDVAGLGSITYVILTLIYTVGIVTYVSRGSA